MLVELGNHAALRGIDDQPKVTTIHIPEADEYGLGGYTHAPGLTVAEFSKHRQQALDYRGGITHLPDHELLQAIVNAWPAHAYDAPQWVKVTSVHETHGLEVGHGPDVAQDIEGFLREFYDLSDSTGKPADLEDRYWTRFGAPGQGEPTPSLPDAQMLYTNAGRVISNVNDGGGQVGTVGTGTAATATTLTTNLTLTLNAWAGYRVYVMQTATGPLIWGNVLSNTAAAGASVLTVDRWYVAATPGGAAATTPSAGFYFMLADGGSVSTWFVGLNTTNTTPAATDTNLPAEYTTAGGGMIRKIAPYSQTSGVATRAITLTPVFTANGSDTLGTTFYVIGVFGSMVAGSGLMKFETAMTQATINAVGDQLTVTETVNGS